MDEAQKMKACCLQTDIKKKKEEEKMRFVVKSGSRESKEREESMAKNHRVKISVGKEKMPVVGYSTVLSYLTDNFTRKFDIQF